ncbi:WYL domain-containing protein [Actinosynnema sp. NPDC047251]|uniref:Transcriptional regulator, DeoR family n=1 Tax=Saccharothrix espanaensis (strain ATCC 51144 / DSM 44229 / JCM 9112 / NBRC 15066 / NRRL 15764) TaxID=1179773 RepID=K0K400_SACES|nr:WYL domain-containing protein [Saccharothrix espanaensis]CCH31569.1 Transcriptional regulator, DeoR family [Saccharothrix espanaensis DSM 44229]
MRADRLVAVLLLMQARGRVTAAELAAELEVSVATARRDLEALSAAGIPVYPQAGRGGGWRLVGRARTDLSGLSAAEAQALFLLVGPAAAVSGAAKAALRKLVRALPETFRADAQAAAEAVVLDPARWGAQESAAGESAIGESGVVGVLQGAVVRRRRVRLSYAKRSGEASVRVVDPLGLVEKGGVWYLVAGTEAGRRTFRVDRVVEVVVTEEEAVRPAGFELSAAWGGVVAEVEGRQTASVAVVVVPARLVSVLRSQFGRHCEVVEEGGGRARVRVWAPSPLMIAQHLAGWGAVVEVVESEGVRVELARLGAELVARYGV